MKHRTTREIYAYWQMLRRDRRAPDRSEIEPAEIRSVLGDTFILEVTDAGEFRFRLAGTRVCALYGRELKAQDFLGLWAGKDRETVRSILAAISLEAAAAVIGFSGTIDIGRSTQVECLLLPLRQTGPGYKRIFGSLVPMDDPYWLGMHPVTRQSINSLRLIWPDENRPFLRHSSDPDLPRPEALSSGAIAHIGARRRVAHLTVYDGGKQ